MGKSRKFRSVDEFLTFIGRSRLRQKGWTHSRMANWSQRGAIPSRHIPVFTVICAELNLELPLHLFSVEQTAAGTEKAAAVTDKAAATQ